MRRIILLSTVLFATPLGIESYAADCATTSCQTLGYTATSNKGNCLQCPFGNYWFCPESQCDSSYQYTCTGYMQSPSGTACNGKYQKCNCSNNYVWNSSQGLCLACTSLCTGYTLTYEQAVSQCGSSNAFACLDNCTGNRMYKCGTNTGSGSDSGSGSSGSDTCTDRIPYPSREYQYTSETGCGGSYYSERFSICGETIYVCSNGRSVGYDSNVHCEYDDRVTLRGYYITDDHNYNMCQNSSGQLKEVIGISCEYGQSYGNTRYATLEECERAAATYDDPYVSSSDCGPCVY